MRPFKSEIDVVTCPIYGPVALDSVAQALLDTRALQRTRRIRQLAVSYLVYPGAVHTRFEHALGVYHLVKKAVKQFHDRGELSGISEEDCRLVTYAGLLHDVAQHMAAHLLEEFLYPGLCHEEAGAGMYATGEIGEILADSGIENAAFRVGQIVQGRSSEPLAGLVASDLDADKVDYLRRDAYHCGMQAGFDQELLLSSLTLAVNPRTGQREVGLDEKGVTAFEQLLYSKNTMYRNVYFNTVVRSATVMLRAMITTALDAGFLEPEDLQKWSDDEVLTILRLRVEADEYRIHPAATLIRSLIDRLFSRRLYHRAVSLPLSTAPQLSPQKIREGEDYLARTLGLQPGEVLIDIPRKPKMLSTNLCVRRANKQVVLASDLHADDGFTMNEIASSLYRASGRVSLYTSILTSVPPAVLQRILTMLAAQQEREATEASPAA